MSNSHDLSARAVTALTGHRFLVVGARGQLGTELMLLLAAHGVTQPQVTGVDVGDIDITDAASTTTVIDAFLNSTEPGIPVVINAAAYTAVDNAESDEEVAYKVNADGPRNLAVAIGNRCRLIHVSTDYTFAGDAAEPYKPTDATVPKTAYGRTKDAGDKAIREIAPDTAYVVRTAWVYGAYGPNFVKTMLKLSTTNHTLSVVQDQVGSPTWTRHLAINLLELATSDAPAGYYHCTGGGQCSWFDFTRAIFELNGLDPQRVEPTTSDAFVRPAPRPPYSVLSWGEWADAGLPPMPEWRAALAEAIERDGQALKNA
ncbi:MAG: dTDP-4-dehydrorhamnose reductase [Cumulibacter sp.]